jgi:probable blue pigment (indigoidine) exporter
VRRTFDLVLTAVAPAVWGSTCLVTKERLSGGYPITVAALRALPAGLVLLLLGRQLPTGVGWSRIFLLGALNLASLHDLLRIVR